MKKKQLTSILLAGIMILSLCVPAFADEGTGGQSTNVEYTALNNESYLLTVPANMTPGETGNVSLTGSWPSTRTMKVTADSNVILTNSINTNDKKTLTISFNEIALAGNNNETVSATGEVSVQDITNANFGEWAGRFSYYVNGEGTGANDPVVLSVPTMAASNTWYKSTQAKNTITSIKFVNSYTPTGSEDETWYADKDNGAVPETQITAYRTGTEIIVAGNGARKIMANEDSSYMFCGNSWSGNKTTVTQNLNSITGLENLDTSNVTTFSSMFERCTSLTNVPQLNTSKAKYGYMSSMFKGCTSLKTIPLLDFSNCDSLYHLFDGCTALESVPAINVSKCAYLVDCFKGCTSLKSILMTGMKASFDISASTQFEESDLVTILNNLATVTSTKTLTMGSTNLAKLTDEEKAIATNKGWTLA